MHQPFAYRIAIVGNPSCTDIRYDDSQLCALQSHGFNTLQLNIAWGCRPADEPLNLEDILELEGEPSQRQKERFDAIAFRAKRAKEKGFRVLFHFGAPRVDALYRILGSQEETDRQTFLHSIQKEEVMAKYEALLNMLADRIPEVDDILMYTFDQEAWLGNEFGADPLAAGIPLADRLPPFLTRMCCAWKAKRPDGTLWWEPWEISAGQIYQMLDRLPNRNFGMMLHNNIAEVQMTNPGDRWFRNMVMLCREKGIPVCGELFLTGANEEVEPLQHMAAPEIIYHQLKTMYGLGVQGVKEYYGTRPDLDDPNFHMAGLLLNDPDLSLEEATRHLCARYAPAEDTVAKAFSLENKGLCLFPWDLSWRLRAICQQHTQWHDDKAFWYPGSVAPSPSWKSTRRAIFMMTEDEGAFHPWLTEDLSQRFFASAGPMKEAAKVLKKAAEESGIQVLEECAKDALHFGAVAEDLALHGEETLAALHIRKKAEKGEEIPAHLLERMERALRRDMENQKNTLAVSPDAESKASGWLEEFQKDPAAFCKTHFQ